MNTNPRGLDDLFVREPELTGRAEPVLPAHGLGVTPDPAPIPVPPAPPVPDGSMFDVSVIAPKPVLSRTGLFGRRVSPADQREYRINLMKTRWKGPRTVLVMNPKGGSGKTPMSILVGAVLGHHSGQLPVVVDNNPTGNLRHRLEYCPDTALTLEDMAEAAPGFTDATPAWVINEYLLHQEQGQFLALPSRNKAVITDPDGTQRRSESTITGDQFDAVWRACTRLSGIIVVDMGNNHRDPQSVAAIRRADAVLLPIIWREDHCVGATGLLRDLATMGRPDLAASTIIVESISGKIDVDPEVRRRYGSFMRDRWGLTVCEIPTDPHIARNRDIRYTQLRTATTEAGIVVGAELAARFSERPPRG